MVKNISRLEGLFVFLAALYFYYLINGIWLLFLVLLLVPDLSMIGYLKDKKLGSITYNSVHNYVLGLFIILTGFLLEKTTITSVGLILAAHVGMDRFFGFGLKYSSNFKDTHIQKL